MGARRCSPGRRLCVWGGKFLYMKNSICVAVRFLLCGDVRSARKHCEVCMLARVRGIFFCAAHLAVCSSYLLEGKPFFGVAGEGAASGLLVIRFALCDGSVYLCEASSGRDSGSCLAYSSTDLLRVFASILSVYF